MKPEEIKSIVGTYIGQSDTTVEIFVQGLLNVQINGANITFCDANEDMVLLTTYPKSGNYSHLIWIEAEKVSSVNITRIKKDEIFI